MADITLLASASQAQTGTSAAVDCSAHGQIRMTIAAQPDFGKDPELDVYFDTAPAEGGPFREIAAVKMAAGNGAYAWDLAKRVILDGADNWLRVRWSLKYKLNWDGTPQTFTMGITGTGVLSA